MAISFARLTVHTRSKGHSAVAASSYRAGIELYDERTGETHDYRNRKDVVYTEVLLPSGASEQFLTREFLWNKAEFCEKRKDAQICKELMLALPKELSLIDQIALTKQMAYECFVQHGLVADIAIHNKLDGNPHAHILVSMRRLKGSEFSLKKARDLNPKFYGKEKKMVFDIWHEKWRECQNTYFREKNIDLSVDEHYLMATRHQGRIRNKNEAHYLRDENALRKQYGALELEANPAAVLSYLSERYATFTEKEIASVIFKNTLNADDFQRLLLQTKAHKHLIPIGTHENGAIVYTTKEIYELEKTMLSQAVRLSGRKDKSLSDNFIKQNSLDNKLQPEQQEAIHYLAQAGDVACLVGFAGAGKTHAMQALHILYQQNNYTVHGAALSGIAAKTLEEKTGIKSDTVYSLCKRIEKKQFQPKPSSVIVIDEAGMIALKDMARIISFAHESRCKVLLLGDPEQLQPIQAGSPFRAILDYVGFFEMSNIQRQHNLEDRKASQNLAQGKIGLAINHYHHQSQLNLLPETQAKIKLIDAWEQSLNQKPEEQIILTHKRTQVAEFNLMAREKLIDKNLLDAKHYLIRTTQGTIELSVGDRIVFLKNNRDIKVYNGDFATITHIKDHEITARLSDKTITFNTQEYKDFNYGYAVTIHKSQGTTIKNAFVYIDGQYWDKHLTYVAMTRHQASLRVFANQDRFHSFDKLKRQLSQSPARHNVSEYYERMIERKRLSPEKIMEKLLGITHGRQRERNLFTSKNI